MTAASFDSQNGTQATGDIGFVRRFTGWLRENRLRAAALASAVLVVLLALGIGVPAVIAIVSADSDAEILEKATKKLDDGELHRAKELALELLPDNDLAWELQGGPLFVMGAATAYEADQTWDLQESDRLSLLAAKYLEQSRDRGFPPGRRGEGMYLLGNSLYHSGYYALSLPALVDAVDAYPSRRAEIYHLLANAYFHQANPQPQEALQWNRQYLNETGLTREERDRGLIEQARMLFAIGDDEACRRVLDSLPIDTSVRSDQIVLRGRLLIRQADAIVASQTAGAEGASESAVPGEALALYQKAIDTLRQAQGLDTLGNQATRRSAYLIGVALRKRGDVRAAVEQFRRTSKLHGETPEALASFLQEAEVLRLQSEDTAAMEAYRQTIESVGPLEKYRNPWVSLQQLREMLASAYQGFYDQGEFDAAIEITRVAGPLFPEDRTVRMRAEAQRAWAESLLEQAAALNPTQAAPLEREARRHLRRAGRTFALLAKLHVVERSYPDDIWKSARAYLEGHDYTNAVIMLREYLRNEARERRAEALVAMSKALLSLHDLEEALKACLECIALHPKDPASYEARLVGSRAYLEQGVLHRSKELLLENLHHEALTPKSREWRDSLFALGNVYYTEGIEAQTKSMALGTVTGDSDKAKQAMKELEDSHEAFTSCVARLTEALARYPDDSRAIEARYWVAQAQRYSARLPQRKLESVTIETTRVALNSQAKKHLSAAITTFQALQEQLNRTQEARHLTDSEKAILRNCYFALGAVYFDLGQYDAAIQAYSTASNRYQHEPESLEALLQIASCHRRLNRQLEARGTIEQAKVILKRIPKDADFERTTRFSRNEWKNLLEWMAPEDTPG